jgi:hypothetical protein
MVALPIELACTGQRRPGLKKFGDGSLQQDLLDVARVVAPGFC